MIKVILSILESLSNMSFSKLGYQGPHTLYYTQLHIMIMHPLIAEWRRGFTYPNACTKRNKGFKLLIFQLGPWDKGGKLLFAFACLGPVFLLNSFNLFPSMKAWLYIYI